MDVLGYADRRFRSPIIQTHARLQNGSLTSVTRSEPLPPLLCHPLVGQIILRDRRAGVLRLAVAHQSVPPFDNVSTTDLVFYQTGYIPTIARSLPAICEYKVPLLKLPLAYSRSAFSIRVAISRLDGRPTTILSHGWEKIPMKIAEIEANTRMPHTGPIQSQRAFH